MVIAWIATRPPGVTSRSRVAEVRGPEPVSDRLDHLHRQHRVVASVDLAVVPQFDLAPGRTDPAAATRCWASRCCSADSVTERTCAPRAAARMHSSPQPVPISSTRLPGPTRAASSRRSILRRCASARSRRRWPAASRTARWNRSWSRRGTRRTVRWTGRSARRRCAGPAPGCCAASGAGARRRSGRSRCSATGTRSAMDVGERGQHPGEVVGRPFAGHVGLAEADQAVAADPAGHRRRAGESPSSAASGRPRRSPSRPDTPAAPAGVRRRGGAAASAIAPTRHSTGHAGTRATSGQRCGIGCELRFPAMSMVTAGRPFRVRSTVVRGTTGTRRSHSVMPWTRIRSAPISGASGAHQLQPQRVWPIAGAPPVPRSVATNARLVLAVQRNRHVEFGRPGAAPAPGSSPSTSLNGET